MNFNLPNDPLGLAVQGRATEARRQQHYADMEGDINAQPIGGPLPDPAWEGLLQAMNEHNVGRVGQSAGTAALASTAGAGQTPLDESSNNIATSYHGRSLNDRADLGTHLLPGYYSPMGGLQAAAPPSPSAPSMEGQTLPDDVHELGQFGISSQNIRDPHRRGTTRMPVMNQRGGDALNSGSQRFRIPNPNE